jgi:hypothetical protein
MAEALGAASLGLGLMNYLSSAQSKKNANTRNATTDKWGPLLALNTKGGGAPQADAPSASIAGSMGPALVTAGNYFLKNKQAPSGQSSGWTGMPGLGAPTPSPDAGVGVSPFAANTGSSPFAGGGMVPKYNLGGAMPGANGMAGLSRPMQQPAMPQQGGMYAGGGMTGMIPGQASVPGDSPMNDTKLIEASPGEVMLPRTVAKEGMHGNKWKVAAYLNSVKKHGPGPMPVKPQTGKAKSSSMSPWSAMCSGGEMK